MISHPSASPPARPRRVALLVAAILVVVLVAGACGRRTRDDNPPPSSDPTAVTPTVPTTAAPTTTASAPPTTAPPTTAPDPAPPGDQPARQELTYDVDGVERAALVVAPSAPSGSSGAPVVVVFHGHGGTSAHAERTYDVSALWPEAVAVYPQGLAGVPGRTDPTGVRSGWQKNPGDQADRDLAFYDALMDDIDTRFAVDPDRRYLFGHSNGARFANVVWNQRGDAIAAVASAAAQGGQLIAGAPPRSLFMLMGEQDPLVPIAGQRLSIPIARERLGTDPATASTDGPLTVETSPDGLELVLDVHPGGHEVPPDAFPAIIAFFERNPRP